MHTNILANHSQLRGAPPALASIPALPPKVMDESEEADIVRLRLWGVLLDDGDEDDDPGIEDEEGEVEENADEAACGAIEPASPRGRHKTYTNELKARVLAEIEIGVSVAQAAKNNGLKSRTAIYGWKKLRSEIEDACANKKRSKVCLGGQGRPCSFTHVDQLIQWVKEMRRDGFPLKTAHVVTFPKEEFSDWATNYLVNRKDESLRRLIRRLIHRHGFSFRRSSRTILSTVELEQEQVQLSSTTGGAIRSAYARECVFNADETVVHFADEPGIIIAEKESKNSAKVRGRSRTTRASVLLTVSAAVKKLPPLIIFRGDRRAQVAEECKRYKTGVQVTVQANAWMDTTVWNDEFVEGVWANYVSAEHPSGLALYVDNLKCHVSDASRDHLAEWGTEMVPLPKNTTSVLQPLDVGIMGPFKKKTCSLSLDYEIHLLSQHRNAPLRERLMLLKNTPASKQREVLVDSY